MAETLTAVNGCNAAIFVDGDNGLPVDVSGSTNKFGLDRSWQIGEYTVFGGQWIRRLACKKDGSLDVEIVYTEAANEAKDIFNQWFDEGGARTVELRVPEADTGSDRYYGEFLLGSFEFEVNSDEAEPIMCSLELKPDGAIHRTTVGS